MPIDIRPEDNKSYYEYKIPNKDVIDAIRNALEGGWNKADKKWKLESKVFIDISPHVGYNVDKDTGEKIATSLAAVHVSNKGIHVVPRG